MPTRLIASLLSLSLVITTMSPAMLAYAAEDGVDKMKAISSPDVELIDGSLPPFPEDANRPPTDWSQVNWDQEVVLPKEQEAYNKHLDELESQGRFAEAVNLRPPKIKLSDEKALQYYNIPVPIREEVLSVAKRINASKAPGQRERFKDVLKQNLRTIQTLEEERLKSQTGSAEESGRSAQTPSQNQKEEDLPRIDFSSFKPVDPSRAREVNGTVESSGTVRITSPRGELKRQDDIIQEKLEEKIGKPAGSTSSGESNDSTASPESIKSKESTESKESAMSTAERYSFSDWVRALFGIHKASAAWTTPLINYYQGIEHNTMDFLLYNWSGLQNQNGSFGSDASYEQSASIFFLLLQFGRTTGDQYTALVNYLTSTAPSSTREKAIKIRVLFNLNQSYTTLMNEVMTLQNTDGGFGISKGYVSDVATTLEVLWAMGGGGLAQTVPAAKALYFVLSKVEQDGSMRFASDADPSFYLVNKTLEYLKPYQNYCVAFVNGAYSIEPTGNPNTVFTVQSKITALLGFLSSSYNTQTLTLQGSNELQDLLGTLYSFQLYGAQQQVQDTLREKTIALQNLNGSFGQSLYTTIAAAKVFPQADLVVTDINPIGSLVNRQAATFQITIHNKGYAPAQGPITLHFFTDKYHSYEWEAVAAGTNINPFCNLTANFTFSFNYSSAFLGDTEIAVYAESAKDHDFTNNWQSETFTFAPDPAGEPAMQTYFIVNQYSNGGVPGFNVRWKAKPQDANRAYFTVLFRQVGTEQWYEYAADPNLYSNGFFAAASYFAEGTNYEFKVGVEGTNQTVWTYDEISTVRVTGNDTAYTGTVTGFVTVDNVQTSGLYNRGYSASNTTDTNGLLTYTSMPNGQSATWVDMDQYEEFITKFAVPVSGTTSNVRLFTALKPDTENPTVSLVEVRQVAYQTRFNNQQEVQLFVMGSDNIAMKEADFSYYDPTEDQWKYIASSSVQNSTTFSYLWYVPASLPLRSGYKIQAVIRDYRGNSSSGESVPFEITDGTIPTGTVSVAGLINSKWKIGEAHTIQWNLSTASPLANIANIRLRWGTSGYEYLAQNYNVALTSLSYSLPLDGRFVAPDAFIDLEFCDVNANCATIESSRFEIEDNSPPLQPPWLSLQPVDPMTFSWPVGRMMYTAYDLGGGNREIVYLEYDGSAKRIVYRKYWSGGWESPVYLANYPNTSAPEYDIQGASIAKAQNGDIHVVYTRVQNTGNWQMDLDSSEIFYSRVSSGSLAGTRQISNDSTSSRIPEIAVTSSRVFILWKEGYSYVSSSGLSVTHFAEGDGYSSWTATEELNGGYHAGNLTVAANGSDPVVLFYDVGTKTFVFRKRTSGAWGTPLSIYKAEILKSKLDQFTSDASRLSTIVDPHPQDPLLYTWKSGIRTAQDLEALLNANGFANTSGILLEWETSQYVYNSYNYRLFPVGGNEYDLFFMAVADASYNYNVYHLKFRAESPDRALLAAREVPNRPSMDSISSYKVLRNDQGNYNLFFVKYDRDVSPPMNRPHHLFYNGLNTSFETTTVPHSVNIGSSVVGATELSDRIAMYYTSYYGGQGERTFASTADYSGVINTAITPVTPTPQSTSIGAPVNLTWSGTGSITGYDVYFGAGRLALTKVATNTASTTYAATALAASTKYYWQIVGHTSNGDAYSNMFDFTTKSDLVPPTVSNLSPATTNITQGQSSLTVTARATDALSVIASAEISIVDANGNVPSGGSWSSMSASDGAFDGQSENMTTQVNTSSWSGVNSPYTISVRTTDAQGNTSESVTANITVTVPVITAPEIEVEAGPNTLVNTGNYPFNTLFVDANQDVIFRIRNSGTAVLNVTENPKVQISGSNSDQFSVLTPVPNSVAAGQTIEFTVRFAPTSQGPKTALLSVPNNDSDENPFRVNLTGAATLIPFTSVSTGAIVEDGTGTSWGNAWGDMDGDSDQDLFVAYRNGENNRLFRNDGGGNFVRIASGSVVNDGGDSMGASFVDYDNDSDLDLFVTNRDQNDFLYQNDGSGNFSRITTGVLVNDSASSMNASWGDYNNDGWLDVVVVTESYNVLYRNEGNGDFTLVSTGAIGNPNGNSQSTSWGDYDNDSDPDLFVANTSNWNNSLYQNNGNGSFTRVNSGDMATDVGLSRSGVWGDYDNDGWLDVFVANEGPAQNFLYHNNRDGSFTKITSGRIVEDQESSQNGLWGDVNNDGWLDLYVVNGYGQNNSLYLNNRDGTFSKATFGPAVQGGGDSVTASLVDFDEDRDLDIFVSNSQENNFLYQNDSAVSNTLDIKLTGMFSNRSAVGARVSSRAARNGVLVTQMRVVDGQSGYNIQNSPILHFGFGTTPIIEQISISWPSGMSRIISNHSLTDSLAGWWSFDTLGTLVTDLSANNNTAGLTNVTFAPGISGRALRFDGVSGSAYIPSHSSMADIFDGGGTFSVWMNPLSTGAAGTGRVAAKNNAGTGWEWGIVSESGGRVAIRFTRNYASWTTGNVIPLNAWTHIAITYNASSASNTPSIFVNGIATSLTQGGNPAGAMGSDAESHLYLGNNPWDSRTFHGDLDEVRLFSESLTPSQVTDLYRYPGSQLTGSRLVIVEDIPDISVSTVSTALGNGSTWNMGTVIGLGNTIEVPLTIGNNGNADLRLSGIPPLQWSGTDAADFSLVSQPNDPIVPGSSETVMLRFAPLSHGDKTATLTISNSDRDETPYIITLTASVPPPGSLPIPTMSADRTSGSQPLEVRFSGESDEQPLSWFWKFGDAAIATDRNPVHTYARTGTYTVELTVTNALGATVIRERSLIRVTSQQLISLPEMLDLNTAPGSEAVDVRRVYGGKEFDLLGSALAMGDFNGDGFEEVAMSRRTSDFGNRPNAGAMLVFWGSEGAFGDSPMDLSLPQSGMTTIHGERSGERFGSAAVFADVNRDGFLDLMVGSPLASPEGRDQAGMVTMVYGRADFSTLAAMDLLNLEEGVTRIWGRNPGDQFGTALASGDVNGDSYADVIIGSPLAAGDLDREEAGEVVVVYGAADLETTRILDVFMPTRSLTTLSRSQPLEHLGASVSGGDLNGDGFDEILMGAPLAGISERLGAGEVVAVFGNALLHEQSAVDLDEAGELPVLRVVGQNDGDEFGTRIAAGDVNGDGYDELVASARLFDVMRPDYRTNAGEVVVVYGFGNIISLSPVDLATARSGITRLRGHKASAELGSALSMGDINGDGLSDVLMGAWKSGTTNGGSTGIVLMYYGSENSAQREELDLNASSALVSRVLGDDPEDYLGFSVANGDVDGDGVADPVMSAIFSKIQNRERLGEVMVIPSRPYVKVTRSGIIPGTPPEMKGLEQFGYRWRAADGSEVEAIPIGDENTTALVSGTAATRLRMGIVNSGSSLRTSSYHLQYARKTGAECREITSGAWMDIGSGDTPNTHWQLVSSPGIQHGDATTNVSGILTDPVGTMTFIDGRVYSASDPVAEIPLSRNQFTELEFSLQPTGEAVGGAAYCLRLSDASAVGTRASQLTLSPGEQNSASLALDNVNGYVYVGLYSAPGIVVQIRLSDMRRMGTLRLEPDEHHAATILLDSANGYGYVVPYTPNDPAGVIKFQLSDMKRVATLSLNAGELNVHGGVIDPSGGFLYVLSQGGPSSIVKIRLSDFTRVDALMLPSSDYTMESPVILDAVNGYLYLGTHTSPGKVVRLRLSDFTRMDSLTFEPGENLVGSGVVDSVGEYAYFGTKANPSYVVRVRLADFVRVSSIAFPEGQESSFRSAFMDATDEAVYVAAYNGPYISKIRLSDFSRVGTLYSSGDYAYVGTVFDPMSGYAYLGTQTGPSKIVKLDMNKRLWHYAFYAEAIVPMPQEEPPTTTTTTEPPPTSTTTTTEPPTSTTTTEPPPTTTEPPPP